MGQKLSRATKEVAEVDERWLRPQGLYPDTDEAVDLKKLRRLILEAKLAPCYEGLEESSEDEVTQNALEDCPICFLHYPSLNRSRCCKKGICTECFLQVKAPAGQPVARCPYCTCPSYAVEYRGPKSEEEREKEHVEEQRVIELKIRTAQREAQEAQERARATAEAAAEAGVTASRSTPDTESLPHLENPGGNVSTNRTPSTTSNYVDSSADTAADLEEIMVLHAMCLSVAEQGQGQHTRSSEIGQVLNESPGPVQSELLIRDMLSLMGLAEPHHHHQQQHPGGGLDAVTIDSIVAEMFPVAATAAAPEPSCQHREQGPSSSAAASGIDVEELSRYLLSAEDQIPAAEHNQVLVGMVLVDGTCSQGGERVPLLSERHEGSQAEAAMVASAAAASPAATSSHAPASEHQGAAGSHSVAGPSRVLEDNKGVVSTEEVEVATAEDCEEALDRAVAARIASDDARLAEAVRLADQIEQWSRPSDSVDGRPLEDHRIQDAVATGDKTLLSSLSQEDAAATSRISALDASVTSSIASADADYAEKLRRQDEEFRRRLEGNPSSTK